MDEIIFTIPWEDRGWHLASYWSYHDGTFSVDNYSDGDHETIEESDLPTLEECEEAFGDYYLYCLETGTDVLDQFIIHSVDRVNQKYKAVLKEIDNKFFIKSVHEIHENKRVSVKNKLSDDVKAFLVSKDGIECDVTREVMNTANPFCGITNNKNLWTVDFTIEIKVPIDPKIIEAEIKQLALKQLEKNHLNKLRSLKLSHFASDD